MNWWIIVNQWINSQIRAIFSSPLLTGQLGAAMFILISFILGFIGITIWDTLFGDD